jgi:hypothetical protein
MLDVVLKVNGPCMEIEEMLGSHLETLYTWTSDREN